jgi:predicted XRE-type DNA-binding protein
LGFPPAEVVVLETKSLLMMKLTELLDASGATNAEAARAFGVKVQAIRDLKKGRIDNFSVDALRGMLARKSVFMNAGIPPVEVVVLGKAKARLLRELLDILDASGASNAQAARRFGVPRQSVADLRKSNTEGLSVEMLIRMVARTGRDVKITFRRR